MSNIRSRSIKGSKFQRLPLRESEVADIAVRHAAGCRVGEYYEFQPSGLDSFAIELFHRCDTVKLAAVLAAFSKERTPLSSDPRDQAHAAGWNACREAIFAALQAK